MLYSAHLLHKQALARIALVWEGHRINPVRLRKELPVRIPHYLTTTDVLLLYPGESLTSQGDFWASRHPSRNVASSFERSLPELRRLLHGASAVIIDATDDHAQAIDAFLQAIKQLGPGAVTVYTEIMHDGLELFVRTHGSLVMLGPSFDGHWPKVLGHSVERRLAA